LWVSFIFTSAVYTRMSDTIYMPPSWAICRVCLRHRHRPYLYLVVRLGRCLELCLPTSSLIFIVIASCQRKCAWHGFPPLSGVPGIFVNYFSGPTFCQFYLGESWMHWKCTQKWQQKIGQRVRVIVDQFGLLKFRFVWSRKILLGRTIKAVQKTTCLHHYH